MERAFESGGVRGVLHQPHRPTGDALILTHGAGSNSDAPLLVHLARAFADAGCLVLRYDLPFRQRRMMGPPHPSQAAADREGIERAAEAARNLVGGRVFAGGQSYGGRQTAMWAAERDGRAAALLLLSYPLHPPGKHEQKRTAFFPSLRIPVLFVHGTNDPFGSIFDLRDAIALIPAPTDLLPVEGASHSLLRAADLTSDILTRFHALT